jgi:hypothetical protein
MIKKLILFLSLFLVVGFGMNTSLGDEALALTVHPGTMTSVR